MLYDNNQRLLLALPFGTPFLGPGVSTPATTPRLHGPAVAVPVIFVGVFTTLALVFVGGDTVTIILFSKVSISPVVGIELCSSAVDAAREPRRSVCSKSASSCMRWMR